MALYLKLLPFGENAAFRKYVINESAYVVTAGTDEEQQEYILTYINKLINTAAINKTTLQINIRLASRNLLRFTPHKYRVFTVERED